MINIPYREGLPGTATFNAPVLIAG